MVAGRGGRQAHLADDLAVEMKGVLGRAPVVEMQLWAASWPAADQARSKGSTQLQGLRLGEAGDRMAGAGGVGGGLRRFGELSQQPIRPHAPGTSADEPSCLLIARQSSQPGISSGSSVSSMLVQVRSRSP